MSKCKEIGHVEKKVAADETTIAWKIVDFSTVTAEEKSDFYKSPTFSFQDDSWNIHIWRLKPIYPEIIFLTLINENAREYVVEYSFSLETTDDNVLQLDTGILEGEKLHNPPSDFFKLSDVLRCKSEVLPADTLTVVCTMRRLPEHSIDPSPLKESLHKKLMSDRSLCDDYKKVFLEGQNHDLILKTGDKEFPVHRDILRARSSEFKSKLNGNMKDKSCEIIDVSDCDPEAMEQFLLYIYCGEVEALDESIMLELYYVAEKYAMASLKEECCDFMKKSLSPTNVCDVIQIALKYEESSLFEYATKYFCNNSQDILDTVEWKSFVEDNFTVANDLLIKFDNFKKLKIKNSN